MPNVMAAPPNSTPQSLADAHYSSAVQQRCQDAKPVEVIWGAPNYRIDLAVSGPKFIEIHCGTCGGDIAA